MRSSVHEEFVKSIRRAVLDKELAVMKIEKEEIVSIMSDILFLGREAIYRRMRGEVKFSLEEAIQVALKLNISLDSLIGLQDKANPHIELNLIEPKIDFRTEYQAKLNEYASLFKTIVQKYDDITITSAFNKLPYILYLHHENIAKFRLFKWAYQMNLLKDISFKDMVMPSGIAQSQNDFIDEIRKMKHTSLVLNSNVFQSFVQDVNYFRDLNLLDDDDADILKNELKLLLAEMEGYAISGMFNSQSSVKLYISELQLDSSYMLFKFGNHLYSHINIYDLGGIESQNQKFCEYHVMWINSLKRYSKLITQSNEIERHRFFREQKKYIDQG